ncbi:hypothetical protein [Paenibacillus sp. NPDC057934]|uniref:hypothetical protein n=1 Tax=Paenibacillus sp. NPDC057934 TaxID=3346282 RepID=UPI0036DBBB78
MDENVGRVVVSVGTKGSGKTKKLISLYEEMKSDGLRVAVFKPFMSHEVEEADCVRARDGRKAPAISVDFLDEIPRIADEESLQAILVDEIQFFEDFEPYKILEGLAMSGIEVYVFGLDVTSDNVTCENIGHILAHADEVHKLRIPCVQCGEEARISKFVGEQKEGVVQLRDHDDYAPYCRACFYGWKEKLEQMKKKVSLTVDSKDFFFICDIDIDRIRELGYEPEKISEELLSLESVVEFIAKMKKVE